MNNTFIWIKIAFSLAHKSCLSQPWKALIFLAPLCCFLVLLDVYQFHYSVAYIIPLLLSFPTGCPLRICVSSASGWLALCCCRGENHHTGICGRWLGQPIIMSRSVVNPCSKPNCSAVWLICVVFSLSTLHTHAKDGENIILFRDNSSIHPLIHHHFAMFHGQQEILAFKFAFYFHSLSSNLSGLLIYTLTFSNRSIPLHCGLSRWLLVEKLIFSVVPPNLLPLIRCQHIAYGITNKNNM